MLLTLTRDLREPERTRGVLLVDGKPGFFTVEDTDRGLTQAMPLAEIQALKIKGRTAIPAGRYRVETTWSPKYQRTMPMVMAVPGFRGIRIHSGNSADDSEGCILPGTLRTPTGVGHSRSACTWLYAEIGKVEAAGGEVWIEIGYGVDPGGIP